MHCIQTYAFNTNQAHATVADSLFSNPPLHTNNGTKHEECVHQGISDEEQQESSSKIKQFWLQNKKFLPIFLLILWTAYSLAAFVIDFERARILFIIEMIVIFFHAFKFIYNKWLNGTQ